MKSIRRWKAHARPGGIPAFLSIDVEPEGFQATTNIQQHWQGYNAMAGFIHRFRALLRDNGSTAPRFGWYFRIDPQITELYGAPDFAMTHAPAIVSEAGNAGDYFGIHPHPLRWCSARQAWIHDFEDSRLPVECARQALQVFGNWAGEPAARARYGAGYLNNDIVTAFDQSAVKVELTMEPAADWGLRLTAVPTSVDSSPMVGPYTDCRTAPRHAYRPSPHDFRVADPQRSEGLVMLPLSSFNLAELEPGWKKLARRLLGRPSWHKPHMFNMATEWDQPMAFWDAVETALDSMKHPYLSLAIRTDRADLSKASRVRQVLELLPQHPLARRLAFVDPVEVAGELV